MGKIFIWQTFARLEIKSETSSNAELSIITCCGFDRVFATTQLPLQVNPVPAISLTVIMVTGICPVPTDLRVLVAVSHS